MKEQVKASILPNLIKSWILIVITLPFIIGMAIKFCNRFIHIFQDLSNSNTSVDVLDKQNRALKFCQTIAPDLNPLDLLTWGNLFSLIVLVIFAFGLGLTGKAFRDIFRLQNARRKAEDEELVDDYIKK